MVNDLLLHSVQSHRMKTDAMIKIISFITVEFIAVDFILEGENSKTINCHTYENRLKGGGQ